MPIKKMFTYVCDTCSRTKEQYGVPDNWQVFDNFFGRNEVRCPICRLRLLKVEYERMERAAVRLLEEEASKNKPPRPEPQEDIYFDPFKEFMADK